MNFLQYDPETGKAFSFGKMEEETLDDVIASGNPVIRVDQWPADFDIRLYDVDLSTKALVRNSYVIPEPTPEPTPEPLAPQLVISDRQFFQQAALDGYISQSDALSAVQTGFIPPAIQAVIDTITDPTEKFNATMLVSGATVFNRNHPLVNAIGSAFSMTPEQIDSFFERAMAL